MSLFGNAAPRNPSAALTLQPGQTYVPPAGWYDYRGGNTSEIQRRDGVTGAWRWAGNDSPTQFSMYFDGVDMRIANTSGCAVGAVVTTAGASYTAAPVVTPSAGNSVWQALLGGAVSGTFTINSGGTNYKYPPLVWIEAPPNPGAQACAYSTIANGVVTAITIQDSGGGYLRPPQVSLINDWRDQTGGGAQASCSLTGAGTITGLVCLDHGNPITSGTIPTLSFASGSAVATAVMDWGIQSVTVGTAGAGYTAAAGFVSVTGAGALVATPAITGGLIGAGSTRPRQANVIINTSGAGAMTTVAAINDPGHYQGIPTPVILSAQPPTSNGALTFLMGGTNTSIFLMPAQQ